MSSTRCGGRVWRFDKPAGSHILNLVTNDFYSDWDVDRNDHCDFKDEAFPPSEFCAEDQDSYVLHTALVYLKEGS